MDNQRHGIRASGQYATYEGREYLVWGGGDHVRLLSDDDPLPPCFTVSTKNWVRGEALIPRTSIQRMVRRRTTCRWRGHRFEVGIITGDLANLTYLDGKFDEVCRLPGMHRPDKYEVIGKVPVSELAELEEVVELPASEFGIVNALRARIRRGAGLSIPYARRWEVGGCEPHRSLRSQPYDGLHVLAAGLIDLGRPLFASNDSLIVVGWPKTRGWWSIEANGDKMIRTDTCVDWKVSAPRDMSETPRRWWSKSCGKATARPPGRRPTTLSFRWGFRASGTPRPPMWVVGSGVYTARRATTSSSDGHPPRH